MKKFLTIFTSLALTLSIALVAKSPNVKAATSIKWEDPYLEEGDVPVYTMGSAVTSFPTDLKGYSSEEIAEFDPNHQIGKGRYYEWDGYKFRAPKLDARGNKEYYYDFYLSQSTSPILEDEAKAGYAQKVGFSSGSLSSMAKNTAGKDLIITRANQANAHWGHSSVPTAASVFFITDATGKVVAAYDNWNTYDNTGFGVYIQFGDKLSADQYNTVAFKTEGWDRTKFDKYDENIKASIAYTDNAGKVEDGLGCRPMYTQYTVPVGGYVYGWGRATLEGQAIFKTAYSDVINGLLKHGNVEEAPTQVKTYKGLPSFELNADKLASFKTLEVDADTTDVTKFDLKGIHSTTVKVIDFTTEGDPTTATTKTLDVAGFSYLYKKSNETEYAPFEPGTTKLNTALNQAGVVYDFIIKYQDPENTYTAKEVKLNTTIVDGYSPVISFNNEIVINPNTPINLRTFLENGSISIDNGYGVDITITASIWADGLNVNNPKIGVYTLNVFAQNSVGKMSFSSTIIRVKDEKAPVLVTQDITIPYGADFNFRDGIVEQFDDSHFNVGLVTANKLNTKVPGKYKVEVEASDEYNNVTRTYYYATVLEESANPATKADLAAIDVKLEELYLVVRNIRGYVIEIISLLDALFQ